MAKVQVTTRGGETRDIDGTVGLSLMEIIRDGGFDELQAICGGSCSCSTCHVYVEPSFLARLPAVDSDEDDLLDSSAHRNGNSRLACQVAFASELDGIAVTIAPED